MPERTLEVEGAKCVDRVQGLNSVPKEGRGGKNNWVGLTKPIVHIPTTAVATYPLTCDTTERTARGISADYGLKEAILIRDPWRGGSWLKLRR